MQITFTGDFSEIEQGAVILLQEAQAEGLHDGRLVVEIKKEMDPELLVEKNGSSCVIACSSKAGFFRGLSLLLHHAGEERYQSREKIVFDTNGSMLDCSRNAVLKVEKIKEIIRRMAALGQNRLMLYLEDTYEVEGHPYFGAYRGRYIQEELRACDDYADLFGIEVIPCIQTLAHLHNVLKWPEFHAFQDTKDVILAGDERTYALLKEWIAAASAPFRSRRIHLGMDEAVQLGLGRYLEENGYHTMEQIMKEHLDRVYAICEELKLEPYIWSDMYITANTKRNYYDIPAEVDTTEWQKPPKGLGLVYWDYYHHEEETYFRNLKAHREIADEVIFAGGSWLWNGVAPNLSKAVDASGAALRACKKLGIKNVVCTNWMDDGAETPIEACYPVMTLFAEAGYDRELTEQNLSAAFKRCFSGSYADFMLLNEFDYIDKENLDNRRDDTPSKYLLYQDVLLGIFDGQLAGFDVAAHYRQLTKKLRAAQENSGRYHDIFAYYLLLSEVLSLKGDMGIRLKRAYDENDREKLAQIAHTEIPLCTERLAELKILREKLWMESSKPFGFEILDIKLGSVSVRLASAARRIDRYLAGDVERLEELSEPRLLYRYREEGTERGLCWESHWYRIISGSDLADTI